jgi:2'-5' RNA ligase
MAEGARIGYEKILTRTEPDPTGPGVFLVVAQLGNLAHTLDNLSMRLFVGIPLADAVIDELSQISMQLRSSSDGLRWTARESWHITLEFLGNTSPEQYEGVVARLRKLHQRPVPIRLGELGFFDRSGVFFAGVKVSPELESLQKRVAEAAALCGFASESRPYHPHITLARSKERGRQHGVVELKARIRRPPTFTGFVAGEFLLYESFLGAGGSRYEIRERFLLDGRASCRIVFN